MTATAKSSLAAIMAIALSSGAPAQSVPISQIVEAEHSDEAQGVAVDRWGTEIHGCGTGDWARYDNVNFLNGQYDSIAVYTVSKGTLQQNYVRPGTIEFRLDTRTGILIASHEITNRHDHWQRDAVSLGNVTGVHSVYVVFIGQTAGDTICQLNRFVLLGTRETPSSTKSVFVSPEGSDTDNDGLTIETPVRTIARASSVLMPGDRCYLRGGIYREVLQPISSGIPGATITYEAYNNEDVYVSAGEPITGWTVHSGNIHKAPMSWTMGEYMNLVWVDGEVMYSARCPNAEDPCQDIGWDSYDTPCYRQGQDRVHPLLIPTMAHFKYDNGDFVGPEDPDTEYRHFLSGGEISECFKNKPADYFKGALWKGFRWWYFSDFGVVTQSDAIGTSSPAYFTMTRVPSIGIKSNKGPAYVSHLLSLLDSPKEWYHGDNTLYLWTPSGDNPSNHLVEAKKRMLVADLTGKNHVTLKGLKLIGGSIVMRNSDHCIIDGCDAKYITQYEIWDEKYEAGWASTSADLRTFTFTDGHRGIVLGGTNNTIRNSLIAVSAGSGIILDGKDNVIENCRIRDCNYASTYDAGIYIMNSRRGEYGDADPLWSSGHRILNSSMKGFGRSGIHFDATSSDIELNPIKIMYNDFQHRSMLSKEGGAIYGYGGTGKYTEIAYNWFHNMSGKTNGIVGLDQGVKHFRIHHNVFWRGAGALNEYDVFCNICADQRTVGDNVVWNNTFVDSNFCSGGDWDPDCSIARGVDWTGVNALYAQGDHEFWQFSDPQNDDYTLLAGSPAIDAGESEIRMVYSDTTEPISTGIVIGDFVGDAPDLGAYEFGMEPWTTPGADWEERPWSYPPSDVPVRHVSQSWKAAAQAIRLSVVPNRLIIDVPGTEAYTVRVFDALGSVCASASKPRGGSCTLATRSLASGVYFVRVSQRAHRKVGRFLLER